MSKKEKRRKKKGSVNDGTTEGITTEGTGMLYKEKYAEE